MLKLHVKLNDTVKVLSGEFRGYVGVIKKIYPKSMKAIVEGVNVVSKHKKKTNSEPGKIVKEEMPIAICKLMNIDKSINEPTRIGRKVGSDGKLRRYSRKTGSFI